MLKQLGRAEDARALLLASVTSYAYNWSAWLELTSLCSERAHVDALARQLPDHWVALAWKAHAYAEVQAAAPALTSLQALSAIFPRAPSIQAAVGTALYNLRQFQKASILLRRVRAADPHRLEDADTLSNILYVQGDRAGLSSLASACFRLDKYRPETCCVVGNYYSLRGEHEKAVLYFRRCLRLQPSYLSAWTLMGHEYVELRNTPAAIECYRRAVEANARDYRAWYGLGQTYEILAMYLYASHYYRKAAALRPYDARMWIALGSAYEQLQRAADAVSCYTRAQGLRDRDSIASLRLAKLYRGAGDAQQAARYYAMYVSEREAAAAGGGGDGGAAAAAAAGVPGSSIVSGPEAAEALLYLAKAALAEGRHAAAEVYAGRVLTMPLLQEVEEARTLLNDVRRLRAAAEALGAAGQHATHEE